MALVPIEYQGTLAVAPAPLTEPTAPQPRPKPRPKAKVGRSQPANIEESAGPQSVGPQSTGPHNTALILDPSFHWEPIINLDPSLDPDYESHGLNRNDENLTPWLMVTSPTASSASTNIATTSTLGLQTHIPAQSSRTKADQLAFEEAKKFIKKGRSHH